MGSVSDVFNLQSIALFLFQVLPLTKVELFHADMLDRANPDT
jgi:hypothetical protein